MQVSALKDEKEKVKQSQSRRVTPSLDTHFECRVGGVTESHFSLDLRAIQPSEFIEKRRKAALHGEGFAWVPDLGSFLKLREVGVSPYLGFILCLRAMLMFELNEVVKGPFDRSQIL